MCPFQRFYKLPDAKRDLLLAVAKAEFAALGYDRASFNRIVKEAGVSKGAMYYYFADKNDLFATVVEAEMQKLESQLSPLSPPVDEQDFWDSVIALVYAATERLMADPAMAELGRALYSQTVGGPGLALERVRQRAMQWIEHAIELGQGVGAIRDDVPHDMLASMVTGLLLGADRWLAEHWEQLAEQQDTLRRLEAQMLEMCRNFLRPPVQALMEAGNG